LSPASVDSAEFGRCDPTSTTGRGCFKVNDRKYAVSSKEEVPWPMTMPARFGSSAASRSQSSSSSRHSGKAIRVEGTSLNRTGNTSAASRASGKRSRISPACSTRPVAP
jgi:hypothetical protein